ncbi:PTS transporter subunit EIIB [Microbacterium sp. SORGH_AS_0862]|uniref:PTS transporter subunit EIIB n=1 Tax=Microbacterium sp. SORGH_AS_0862 TaxID=3041789 RepID=UPI0027951B93|nr:PTS transporter subunit EIIB [Microbacterium sp. SORGH_AS_0862]MDQ1206291.1 glucose-like phosphotransferase system IIB component [Microbacterium sp. SORGH_AS_0862]
MAAVNYSTLAGEVLAAVGGEDNVAGVVHCATRLRFTLRDRARADKDAVTALPGVITVVENGGQFQVVVGNNVSKVYAGLPSSLTEGDRDPNADGGDQKVGILSRVIDVVSAIFAPVLGVLAATGILKGLLIILSTTGVLPATSTTYQVLFATADAFFAFLPMLLAVTTARKFGANVVDEQRHDAPVHAENHREHRFRLHEVRRLPGCARPGRSCTRRHAAPA